MFHFKLHFKENLRIYIYMTGYSHSQYAYLSSSSSTLSPLILLPQLQKHKDIDQKHYFQNLMLFVNNNKTLNFLSSIHQFSNCFSYYACNRNEHYTCYIIIYTNVLDFTVTHRNHIVLLPCYIMAAVISCFNTVSKAASIYLNIVQHNITPTIRISIYISEYIIIIWYYDNYCDNYDKYCTRQLHSDPTDHSEQNSNFFYKFYFPAIIVNQNDLHDDDDDSQTKLIST